VPQSAPEGAGLSRVFWIFEMGAPMRLEDETLLAEPRFSLVVLATSPNTNPETCFRAIEAQSFDLGRVQVVLVTSVSSPGIRQAIAWAQRHPRMVTLEHVEPGSGLSARNRGLDATVGEWISFLDAEDLVGEDWLSEVDEFIKENRDVAVAAANHLRMDEHASGTRAPVAGLFSRSSRLVNLARNPNGSMNSIHSRFFRRKLIAEKELRFDDRLDLAAKESHFANQYLLNCDVPNVGYVAKSHYLRGRAGDQQSDDDQPWRFHDTIRWGYLSVLDQAQLSHGRAPLWLQLQILSELLSFLRKATRGARVPRAPAATTADDFHRLMPQLLAHFDPNLINSFLKRRDQGLWRDILLHAWQDERWSSSRAVMTGLDNVQGLARFVYRYVGSPPEEELFYGDEPIRPSYGKRRAVKLFDRGLVHERIVWIETSGPIVLRLDGELIELVGATPDPGVSYASRRRIGRMATELDDSRSSRSAIVGDQLSPAQITHFRKESTSNLVTSKYGQAWVLMDRVTDADDSGEHLFRYLREVRPDVNAWFVLLPGTPDWDRLVADGYEERLVAYGSHDWQLLLANCVAVISSHSDIAIRDPPEVKDLLTPDWRFVFLQHGVIKDDLSDVFNRLPIDLFITSTPREYESIVADSTGYVFTKKEVQLTELPRFDRLLAEGERFPRRKRDLVLMAPTWRAWLAARNPESHDYTVTQDFLGTEFAHNWLGILSSDRVAAAAAERGLQVALLLHPVFQSILSDLSLPAHVTALKFQGENVREYIARSALFVTDYSSMAFNAAYIERPVVYFQFDQKDYFGGAHFGREGYFDYDTQGFGPVATDVAEAEALIVAGIASEGAPASEYLRRVAETFPYRDGRARERVTGEIERLLPSPRSKATQEKGRLLRRFLRLGRG
jgi:hypothetical protein